MACPWVARPTPGGPTVPSVTLLSVALAAPVVTGTGPNFSLGELQGHLAYDLNPASTGMRRTLPSTSSSGYVRGPLLRDGRPAARHSPGRLCSRVLGHGDSCPNPSPTLPTPAWAAHGVTASQLRRACVPPVKQGSVLRAAARFDSPPRLRAAGPVSPAPLPRCPLGGPAATGRQVGQVGRSTRAAPVRSRGSASRAPPLHAGSSGLRCLLRLHGNWPPFPSSLGASGTNRARWRRTWTRAPEATTTLRQAPLRVAAATGRRTWREVGLAAGQSRLPVGLRRRDYASRQALRGRRGRGSAWGRGASWELWFAGCVL